MPTRRDFALTVGAATLGACVRAPSVPSTPAVPTPVMSPVSSENDATAPLADAMTELVKHRYGAHLSEEQIGRVKSDIRDALRASDRLRAILLPNATEPDVMFAVHRGAGQ
jgi:hypothetical protein